MSEHNPWVTLTHPKTGGVFECPESSVAHWESLGWRRQKKASEAKAATTDTGRESSKSTSEKE